MKAVLQRVKKASVSIEGAVCGEIGQGLMILLGVGAGDTEQDAEIMASKIAKLRIFSDEDRKMNLSVRDVEGEALIVSNFTLYANCEKGNRPDFLASAPPAEANALYETFVRQMKREVRHVATGEFGADMEVSILNDGPVTILLDSHMWLKKKQ